MGRRVCAVRRGAALGGRFQGITHCKSACQESRLVHLLTYCSSGDGWLRTETHAGPETRTTAIAALPGAVDRAYIVESASSINLLGEQEVKLRLSLEICCPAGDGRISARWHSELCRPAAGARFHAGRKEAQRKTRQRDACMRKSEDECRGALAKTCNFQTRILICDL